ncbi:MAG: hypothetical protein Q8M09_05190 [Pseudomonadota bacterium]|nr:hypothetical protein [Pseudomonadota bacterium]MDP1903630.1 hypothetical protein [Pseudomonadota bacterium]MDP2353902.1 hypothetical protein [Pseudomonadota bacterium]
MIEMHLSKEARLALFAALLFGLAIVLAALGEKTLPLFGGDRELAARVYKSTFAVLLGGVAGLLAPFVVIGFVNKVRSLFAASGGDHAIAQLLMRDDVPRIAERVGFLLLAVFIAFGLVVAVVIWFKGA